MLHDLGNQDYAKSTIESAHVTAGLVFKYAIKHKYRKDNPHTGAVMPVKMATVEDLEKDTVAEKYLERHELTEFLAAAREHGKERDMESFYLSGMRSSEMCSLKWSDIHYQANEIRIINTIYSAGRQGGYELTPPKTVGSIRTIDIDSNVMASAYSCQHACRGRCRHKHNYEESRSR